MINRGQNSQAIDINVVGSSSFGRYPKISIEKTYNMFISDNWLVPFNGYQVVIPASSFIHGGVGRGIYSSAALNRLICVVGAYVYLVNIFFDQNTMKSFDTSVTPINTTPLATSQGVVYITGDNTPHIAISDGVNIYIYDPNNTNANFNFYIAASNNDTTSPVKINFKPGYITFHDSYFIVAATDNQSYTPAANNTWILSQIAAPGSPGYSTVYFDSFSSSTVGLIQTKPDQTQAVVRVPSKGNMVMVMGTTVSEMWYDQGLELFPYARSTAFSIDYGCLNPATIAATDEIVVWLAANEKAGPIIMYTKGGPPEKITTDGIDYLFSQLQNPANSQAFIIRQDGHLIYLINFYTDNLSLFYDFNTGKFFHASDENLNYFKANEVGFFNNQYYFLTSQNGNLYALDTIYTYYSDANDANNNPIKKEIPRIRSCKSVRRNDQSYFVANDIGFTIESGETETQQETWLGTNPANPNDPYFYSLPAWQILLEAQDGNLLVTQANYIFLITQDGFLIETQDKNILVAQTFDKTDVYNLVLQNLLVINKQAAVDLSISIDGGASFSSDFRYELPRLGYRKNRLMWWQLGIANDFTAMFKFWGLGRFVCYDGVLNIRQ